MPPEHRHERLLLEPGHRRVAPGQRRRIRDVDEAHAVARVVLPVDPALVVKPSVKAFSC